MGREFYNSPKNIDENTNNESVSGYIVEEKYCRSDSTSSRYKYFFIISNPKTYSLKTIEVGKYTYNEYDEGDELD